MAATDVTFSRPAELLAELIPAQNPYQLQTGAALTVRVLADGKPLLKAQGKVRRQGVKKNIKKIEVRANQNDRILFHLSTPGTYLISTTRIYLSADSQLADW